MRDEAVERLQKMISESENIVFFRWSRCFHRKWDTRFSECRRLVPSAVGLSS